ncbi:DUF397 domain-containing protein [Nocardia seriolae]|uniref:DUF397 domain-containing protein n=1 Tax=Nocardia seriolae TaxID=37332 RepID=A0ABC9YX51_9NOCA|nr:DUF397 domain-containing protein [Nocardia seriolae]BEK98937.1 hypothetical protein NSER024013_68430 [Nocardia seriolae]GAM48178.1 hypothetical protein NS07_v2contig00067-0011 [Nocardia seriolae]GAP30088.1 hypothetical protein NSK11_contig00072-0011 [Nocardia seriolae]
MSTEFFKSTFSGGEGTCVEIAHRTDRVVIRDSKYAGPPHIQPILEIVAALWPTFLDLVLSGESCRIGDRLSLNLSADGSATIDDAQGFTLDFDPAEWTAFTKGVVNGEFTF